MNHSNSYIIYSYSRKQAIADGEQILLNDVHPKPCSHIYKYPVYLTSPVYEQAKTFADKTQQNLQIVILNLLSTSAKASTPLSPSLRKFEMPWGDTTFFAECGPTDIDDPSPAITIMTEHDL